MTANEARCACGGGDRIPYPASPPSPPAPSMPPRRRRRRPHRRRRRPRRRRRHRRPRHRRRRRRPRHRRQCPRAVLAPAAAAATSPSPTPPPSASPSPPPSASPSPPPAPQCSASGRVSVQRLRAGLRNAVQPVAGECQVDGTVIAASPAPRSHQRCRHQRCRRPRRRRRRRCRRRVHPHRRPLLPRRLRIRPSRPAALSSPSSRRRSP